MKRLWMRVRRYLQSIMGRLVVSHVMVGVITISLVLIFGLVLSIAEIFDAKPVNYLTYANDAAVNWLLRHENGLPNVDGIEEPGFSLVVSSDEQVLFVQGDSPCRVQMALSECAPLLTNVIESERFVEIDHQRWAEVVLPLATGDRAITRRLVLPLNDFSAIMRTGLPFLTRFVQSLLMIIIVIGVLSIPSALLLVWWIVRPLVRRLLRIALASRQFADGDLTARVGDAHLDEVGQLGQQFDAMADALQQNVHLLRDLVQVNANLVIQAEQSAILAERNRLSRDLHDAIAQRLFSLTVSTSVLPATIEQNCQHGVEQARAVAQLAEQTLLDLRTLLIDLRPATIVEQGLVGALQKLCDDWGRVHSLMPTINTMLSGKHLSSAIESTVYHLVQECLNNVAKHARATEVSISIIEGQHQMVLSISDNGVGFSMESRVKQGHLGLISMQERAESVGGRFTIESGIGRGTTIQVILPIFMSV